MDQRFQAAILAVFAVGITSCSPKTGSETSTTDSRDTTAAVAAVTPIERGAYLARVSGCHDCHTPGTFYGAPDMKRALSGSDLGWKGPWGVSYASNLTPDAATGLGAWTDEEVRRAIQDGVRKNGSPVAPPMPWPNYAHFTRQDAMAIIAYLRSIPAVVHKVPDRVPPNGTPLGPVLDVPPPPAWDVPPKPAS